MSRFTCTIHSRGYEMDARQRVSPGALARYMEHARWEAIAKGSLGFGELFASGNRIVVRAQDLHIGTALVHGATLELASMIARVGNSSFTFLQTATRVSDGSEVARSFVTAVVLSQDGRPTRVPDALRVHEEPVEIALAPVLHAHVPEHAFARTVGVRPSDFDTLLHVNQSRYIEYVDDTRALAAYAAAISGKPFQMPTRVFVDYRRETKLGDDLSAKLWWEDEAQRVLACDLFDLRGAAIVARARLWM